MPSKELSHLLWLVIHYPSRVAPVLAEADPRQISDEPEVLAVLIRLASGQALTALTEEVAPELARTLRAIAARQGEYEEERAAIVATELLARMELPFVDSELRAASEQRTSCTDPAVKSSYADRIRALTARKKLLTAVKTGSARSTES